MDQIAPDTPLEFPDVAGLVSAFARPRPREGFLIGGEFEFFGIDVRARGPLGYEGPRGIAALFAGLVARGWTPVLEGGRAIALGRGRASLTLEPGGQVELSGAPHPDLDGVEAELVATARELVDAGRALGVAFYQVGRQPFFAEGELPWMPKERYSVMRAHFAGTGDRGHRMMQDTGGLQVNLDASSEADLARKFRVAMRFSPVATAMFANSPVRAGEVSGFLSERADIWLRTDPARTGLVRASFDSDFALEDYARFALDVPMLFVRRDGHYLAMDGMPFARYLERGHGSLRATWADWRLHLSTLFTDVRLKGPLEIRCMDALPFPLSMAPLALWTALLYDERALGSLEELVRGWSYDAVAALAAEVPRTGLAARIEGRTVRDIAVEAVSLATAALRPSERRHLAPFEARLHEGGEPARAFVAGWTGGWRGDLGAFLAANGIQRWAELA